MSRPAIYAVFCPASCANHNPSILALANGHYLMRKTTLANGHYLMRKTALANGHYLMRKTSEPDITRFDAEARGELATELQAEGFGVWGG